MHKACSMPRLAPVNGEQTLEAVSVSPEMHKAFSMADMASATERSPQAVPGSGDVCSVRRYERRAVAAGMRIADLYFAEELRDSIGAEGIAAWLRETSLMERQREHAAAHAGGVGLRKVRSLAVRNARAGRSHIGGRMGDSRR